MMRLILCVVVVILTPTAVHAQTDNPTCGTTTLATYPHTAYAQQGQSGTWNIICANDYERLAGNEGSITCGNDGTWSDEGPFCGALCGVPPVPDNGDTVSSGNNVVEDTATVSCNEGYTNTGETLLTCVLQGDGTGAWEPDISGTLSTQCQIVNCNAPANPPDATITATTTTYGEVVPIVCNTGFEFVNGAATEVTCEATGTWSPDPNNITPCQRVVCGDPVAPANAMIALDDGTNVYQSTATITCITGFKLNPGVSTTVTCESDGNWSPDPATLDVCQQIDCGTPTAPGNAMTTLASGTSYYNDVATIDCNTGYKWSDGMTTVSLTCQLDGTWDTDPATLQACQLKDCGALPSDPDNGAIALDTIGVTTYGAGATITCNQNYQLNPAVTAALTCDEDEQWSPAIPAVTVCEFTSCQALPSPPENAMFSIPDAAIEENTVATIVCNEGFDKIAGTEDDITCQSDGSWSPDITVITDPFCERKECGALPNAPANTEITLDVAGISTFESTASIDCVEGYELRAGVPTTLTCGADGTWGPDIGSTVFCEIKTCSVLPTAPANTLITLDGEGAATFGSTASITCADGYELDDGVISTLTCGADATWGPDISDTTFCIRKTCPALPTDPANTQITLDEAGMMTYDSTASISCDEGFELVPGVFSTLTCESDATWQPSITGETFCRRKDCGNLPDDPPHTYIVLGSDSTTFGSTALIRCDTGYTPIPDTNNLITCIEDGTWSPNIRGMDFCEIINCETLPVAPENTEITLDSSTSTYLSSATIGCVEGYQIITTSSFTSLSCDTEGNWTPDISGLRFCEQVTCDNFPVAPANGMVTLTDGTSVYNSTAQVSCMPGYQLIPNLDPVLICTQMGMWSPDPENLAYCQLITCNTLPNAPENAMITLESGSTTHESTATISCLPGFDLIEGRETTLSCNNEGDWHPAILDAAYCEPKTCAIPIAPEGTIITLTEPGVTTFGATASVTCSENYQRTAADQIITCNDQGQWSPAPTTTLFCQLITCNTLPIAPENAMITLESGATTFQSTATISCVSGYELIAEMDPGLTCNNVGDWTPEILEVQFCQRKDCGIPQGGEQTTFTLTDPDVTTYEATATVSCTGDYVRSSADPIITCNGQGVWDPSPSNSVFCYSMSDPCLNAVCAADERCQIMEGNPTCVSSADHNSYIAIAGMAAAMLLLLILPLIIHYGRRRYKKKEAEPVQVVHTQVVTQPARPYFVHVVPKVLMGRPSVTPANAIGYIH